MFKYTPANIVSTAASSMTLKIFFGFVIALSFPMVLSAQHSVSDSYEIVDSVSISTASGNVKIWIGYSKLDPIGSSLIIYKKGNENALFKDLLQPYRLKEKGKGGYTYGGHTVKGTTVAFCQIDAFHVDSLYVDFSENEPIFLKSVRRGHKKEFENFKIEPRKKITIKKYLRLTENERAHATKVTRIKWESPLGTRMTEYTTNGRWLPNYVISETVTLESDKRVFLGFDKRDWCSVLLVEHAGRINNYRDVFYANTAAIEKGELRFGVSAHMMSGHVISFVQQFDNCYDSIFIIFSQEVPYYQRIIHTCGDSDRKERVQITPKNKVGINEARTYNGDVFGYPSEKKKQMFDFRRIRME